LYKLVMSMTPMYWKNSCSVKAGRPSFVSSALVRIRVCATHIMEKNK
jgi:hypothetical protein